MTEQLQQNQQTDQFTNEQQNIEQQQNINEQQQEIQLQTQNQIQNQTQESTLQQNQTNQTQIEQNQIQSDNNINFESQPISQQQPLPDEDPSQVLQSQSQSQVQSNPHSPSSQPDPSSTHPVDHSSSQPPQPHTPPQYTELIRQKYFNPTKPQNNFKTELYIATIVGDTSTGKTSVLKRLFKDEFDQFSKATTAVDSFQCVFEDEGRNISLTFFDTAGQEQFKAISTPMIKKNETFNLKQRENWIHFIKQCNSDCQIITIVNKCDLIDQNKLRKLQDQYKDWIFVSAKSGKLKFQQEKQSFIKKIDVEAEQNVGGCC